MAAGDRLAWEEGTPAGEREKQRRGRPVEPLEPAAPASRWELALGYLDQILRELEGIHADQERPGGSGSIGDAGSVTGPAAGATIVSVPAPGAGRYSIVARTLKSGAGVGGNVNAQLWVGGAPIADLLTLTTAQDHPFADVHLRAGDDVRVRVLAADGGVDYMAFLVLTRMA